MYSLTFSLIFFSCFILSLSQDPADSWLSYAAFNANGAKITGLNCTWIVPSNPGTEFGSNAPGWWFGIQTGKGDGALIQPILAYGYEGYFYSIFDGVFDWTDGSWHTSDQSYKVAPGDKIVSSIVYVPSSNSYTMVITSTQIGKSVTMNYKLQSAQTEVESVAYFVVEHQPETCNAYPTSNECTFSDIVVEVENQVVSSPKWEAMQKDPACDSKATVVDSSTIKFTWNSNAQATPKKWGYGL
jgi:hypothetical protein